VATSTLESGRWGTRSHAVARFAPTSPSGYLICPGRDRGPFANRETTRRRWMKSAFANRRSADTREFLSRRPLRSFRGTAVRGHGKVLASGQLLGPRWWPGKSPRPSFVEALFRTSETAAVARKPYSRGGSTRGFRPAMVSNRYVVNVISCLPWAPPGDSDRMHLSQRSSAAHERQLHGCRDCRGRQPGPSWPRRGAHQLGTCPHGPTSRFDLVRLTVRPHRAWHHLKNPASSPLPRAERRHGCLLRSSRPICSA